MSMPLQVSLQATFIYYAGSKFQCTGIVKENIGQVEM